VFDALMDPKMTRQYWLKDNASDWTVGSTWEHREPDGSAAYGGGRVVAVDRPDRLVFTWGDPGKETDLATHSRVTFQLSQQAGVTRLLLTHEDFRPEQRDDLFSGWTSVLSSLKSLLETGKSLGDLWQRG
jgi:uncharacterized protein YndB with AHSA1/START domain